MVVFRASVFAALLSTLTIACGDGVLELTTPSTSVAGTPMGGGQVFYLERAEGVVSLSSDAPFRHVEFHLSLVDGEIRTLDAAGLPLTDWQPVDGFVEDSDPVAREGVLNLPGDGRTVELRLRGPVEFGRIVVGPEHDDGHEGDVAGGGHVTMLAHAGAWVPPQAVIDAGNQQYLPYTGAPARCSGTFLPGTRALADHLVGRFPGAVSYGGYNCRANTANPSELSVHASGRAIDLFVPLSGGQADNDLGDPIAHYLIENAQRLGIEFIVWDRSSWGSGRSAPKHRGYGGPHPHHDHLHIELAPWAAHGSPNFDTSPIGFLDVANCGGIAGWAQDPDAPHQPINVYVSIGGPVFAEGAIGYWAYADEHRDDLCAAIGSCNHGWYVKLPHGLMDGVERSVYVYGEDVTGGQNSALGTMPQSFRCDRPALPYSGEQAVKRHIPDGFALQAWGFDWNDIILIDDNTLATYPDGATLPAAPTLRSEGLPIYVVEGQLKRHVPDPRAMKAWGFDWGAVQPQDLSGFATGAPLEARPYLVRGSGPAVYVLWPR